MRKFLVFLGIACLLIGARFSQNWVLFTCESGELTVFNPDGSVTVYVDDFPLTLPFDQPVRLDLDGGMDTATTILFRLNASILWTEKFDNLTIIYAFSKQIPQKKLVLGKTVNLMLAVSSDSVALGSPILLGSY